MSQHANEGWMNILPWNSLVGAKVGPDTETADRNWQGHHWEFGAIIPNEDQWDPNPLPSGSSNISSGSSVVGLDSGHLTNRQGGGKRSKSARCGSRSQVTPG